MDLSSSPQIDAAEVQTPDIAALIDGQGLTAFQIWVMVMIGGVVVMDGFDLQAMGFVAPALVRDWRIDAAALGPVFAAGLVGMLLGSLALSVLADRIGRRPVLLGSTVFFGACMLATAAVHALPQLAILRFVTGFGVGGVMGNAVALASEYSPQRRRASLLMWISCGFTGGAIAGGLISAALIPIAGWRSVFMVGGVAPLVIAVIMAWGLPESLQFLSLQPRHANKLAGLLRRISIDIDRFRGVRLAPEAPPRSRGSIVALFQAGRGWVTPLLWAVSFANLLNLFFLSNWLPLLATRMGLASSTAVLMGTTLQLGGLIGALVMGPLIDRVGFFRVLVPTFLMAGIAVAAIGAPGVPVSALFLVVFAAGVCVVGAQPAINALAATLYPTEIRATGVGWTLGVGRGGAIVGPILAAQLLARRWSSQDLFFAAAVPAALSCLIIIALAATVRARRQER